MAGFERGEDRDIDRMFAFRIEKLPGCNFSKPIYTPT